MKLIWNGHSCFTIQSEDGTLVLDPYQDGVCARSEPPVSDGRPGAVQP